MRLKQLVIPLILALSCTAGAREIPTIDFFKHAEFALVKLSPTGEYLAVTVPQDDRTLLAVLRTKDKTLVAKWDYGQHMEPVNVTWVNDERFMVQVAKKTGSLDVPIGNPDIYMANADGSKRMQLPLGGTYQLIDKLNKEPNYVLMQRTIERPNLFKLNVYNDSNSAFSKVAVSPMESGSFAVDHDGKVRYASGENKEGTVAKLFRMGNDGKWAEIASRKTYDDSGEDSQPVGFAADNKNVYMAVVHEGKPETLELLDPETKDSKVLFEDKVVDVGGYIWNHDHTQVLGVNYEDGIPANKYFDLTDPESALLANLDKAFAGQAVDVTSQSKDGKLLLLHAYSDTDPGSFYLFDTTSKKATFLLANRSWIKPEEMSAMKPITVKARDGLTLHGYLTIPRGSNGKNLPMVMYVHGGPHGIRDDWGWEPAVQFLANRGYAVMQMNYRGSGGYGDKFLSSGYRKWGTTMQDDLTDSVKWAENQGIVDSTRVCIFGGSYGGYAALMSAVREPDLYKCTIGYAGVYSMPLQAAKSDTARFDAGQTYLSHAFPETLAGQQAQSSAYQVEKLKAAVMLAHGKKDERVPIANMYFLIDQMAKVGKKPEVVVVQDKEMHGFYEPEHNVDLYNKIQAFLAEHIGSGTGGKAAGSD